MPQRYKLTIEYDGAFYCGWQRQSDIEQKSVEEVIEQAINQMASAKVKIFASGRTDAGVHASGQVAHFDLDKKFTPYQIIRGLNFYLRDEMIAVVDCELVDENFHARFGAKMRHYQYRLINRHGSIVLNKNRAWHVGKKLDLGSMKAAAKKLEGRHDFSSFRDSECQAQSPIRSIDKIEILQNGEEIIFNFSAKSFLHHMVRNIVGTLVYVGLNKFSAKDVELILQAKDRQKSGPNAPACGLYFLGVDY